MSAAVAVFFDIGDTLADPVVAGGRVVRLDVYPFVAEVLTRLRVAGGDGAAVDVGLISNTGDLTADALAALLTESGLGALVDPALCLFSSVEGLDKSQPAMFEKASARAGVPAASCVYVGEDASERAVARSTGFLASPHPLHALFLVESALQSRPGSA